VPITFDISLLPAPAATAFGVLFIDSRVADIDTLVCAAQPGTRAVVLNSAHDGLTQIAGALHVCMAREIHMRPDRAAKYEVVAGALASAQRLGLTKIGLVGSEQFAPP
jgi:hypothetical protein